MYTDTAGNIYQSYEQACIIHGCDTPAQLKAEDDWVEAQSIKKALDAMEIWGRTFPIFKFHPDDPF
jgi:hypothetical protein